MKGGSGRCLCGAVRYSFEGPPLWQIHCHCESCRRATSSGFTSFLSVRRSQVRWTGECRSFQSSARVIRRFCPTCGSQMSYQTDERPDDIDLYAATLDDPGSFRPTHHCHWQDHLAWAEPGDDLPRVRLPRRMQPGEDFSGALALIRLAFAGMDGRIDPPSSATRLTAAELSRLAERGEVWVMEEAGDPIACMALTFEENRVYLGKLATHPDWRRRGLAALLVDRALRRAKDRGLPAVELQTRVELAENHAAFRAMGFEEVGRTAHPGYTRPTSITFRRAVADPRAGCH